MGSRYFTGVLFFIIFSSSYAQPLKWDEVTPGVWKAIIGLPESYDLLKASKSKPNVEALASMPTVDFPLNREEITAEILDGKKSVRFPLEREEQIFGFGLQFKTVYQRGRILRLHVDHDHITWNFMTQNED